MAANRSVPATSMPPGCGERVAGTTRPASMMTTTPIGTLTRKIGRQSVPAMSAVTSRPPASWPTTAAMPDVAPYRARARALRSPCKVAWNVARTCGTSRAADAPWTRRAAISEPMPGARPQANEVRTKPMRATRNIRRRPKRSPSRPPRTSSAAYVMPYPATTSSNVADDAWRLVSIEGRATFTMKKSAMGRKAPIRSRSTPNGLRSCGAWVAATFCAGLYRSVLDMETLPIVACANKHISIACAHK